MSRSLYSELYRESPGEKAFMISLASGMVVYCVSAALTFFALLRAQPSANPPSEQMTGFAPWVAFVIAIYYAVATALVVFVLAAVIFWVLGVVRRRRDNDI